MNIDSIKKHYNVMTPRERFALEITAMQRGDKVQRAELHAAAPKTAWRLSDTAGLHDGWDFLTQWHLIQQLGTAATFMQLIAMMPDVVTVEHNEETRNTYSLDDAIRLASRRFMEGLEAFKIVCKEYNLDPEAMTHNYHYSMILSYTELVIKAGFEFEPLELADLQSTIEAYREVIEHHVRQWQ